MRLSRYIVKSPPLLVEQEHKEYRAIYSTRSTKILFVENDTIADIEQKNYKDTSDSEIKELLLAEVVVPEEEENQIIVNKNLASLKDSKSYFLLFSPYALFDTLPYEKKERKYSMTKAAIHKVNTLLETMPEVDMIGFAWNNFGNMEHGAMLRYACKKIGSIAADINAEFRLKIALSIEEFQHPQSLSVFTELPVKSVELDCSSLLNQNDETALLSEDALKRIGALLGQSDMAFTLHFELSSHHFSGVRDILDQLEQSNDKQSLFFAFSPASSLSLSQFSSLEMELLDLLSEKGFQVNFVPSRLPTSKVLFIPEWKEYFVTAADSFSGAKVPLQEKEIKAFYNSVFAQGSLCNDCELFPLCGGMRPSARTAGRDCPPYKENIEQRLIQLIG